METWCDLILNHAKKLDPRSQQSKAVRSQLNAGLKPVHVDKSEQAEQNRNNPEYGSALQHSEKHLMTWPTKQQFDWPQETMSKRSSWPRETCCIQRPKTMKSVRSSALSYRAKFVQLERRFWSWHEWYSFVLVLLRVRNQMLALSTGR